jgi:hypothetical protein
MWWPTLTYAQGTRLLCPPVWIGEVNWPVRAVTVLGDGTFSGTITASLQTAPSGAVLSGTLLLNVTNVNGQSGAVFANLRMNVEGTYQLRFTSSIGLTPCNTPVFTVGPSFHIDTTSPAYHQGCDAATGCPEIPVGLLDADGRVRGSPPSVGAYEVAGQPPGQVPTQLGFSTQPQNGTVNVVLPVFAVQVRDASGNVVSDDNGRAIQLQFASNPSGATLGGSTLSFSSNGTATFSNVTVNLTGVNYTLQAISAPLLTGTSNVFTISGPSLAAPPINTRLVLTP